MTGPIFERTLATADIEAVFADAALISAMLDFEAALAAAQADEGIVPEAAAAAIAAASAPVDVDAAARHAGRVALAQLDALPSTTGSPPP